MYTLTRGTSAHVTWSAIILHMACVFIDPTPRVPFKTSMPQMVRVAIIEYALILPQYCVTNIPFDYYQVL